MQQPEAYIGGAGKLFDDKGGLADPKTAEFLRRFVEAFTAWIALTTRS